MPNRFSINLFYGFAFLFFIIMSAFSLVVPTTTFEQSFSAGEPLQKYYGFCLIIFGLGITVFTTIGQIYSVASSHSGTGLSCLAQSKWPSLLNFLLPTLGLLCVVMSATQLTSAPLDLDELQQAAKFMYRDFWYSIHPAFHTEIHPIAHLSSILSLKVFGINKFAYRLPSVIFTILFFVSLFWVCRRYFSAFSSILVFCHLCVSPFAIWYFHSARGYASSMFVVVLALAGFLELTQSKRSGKGLPNWVWITFCFLSILCHPFAGIAVGLFCLSYILWLHRHRLEIDKNAWPKYFQGLNLIYVIVPTFLVILAFIGLSLERGGDFAAGKFPDWENQFLALVGLGRNWLGRLVLLLLTGIGISYFLNSKKPTSFLSYFVFCTVGFYALVLFFLEVDHLRARWFLPFVAPFFLWFGEIVHHIAQRLFRSGAMTGALGLFVVVPGINFWEGYSFHVEPFKMYESYIEQVREKTAPVSKNCYYFPEKSFEVMRARVFFFNDALSTNEFNPNCQKHYTLIFGQGEILGEAVSTLKPIHRFNTNYIVYEGISKVPNEFPFFVEGESKKIKFLY